ncbi:phospholipid carrier-dependent glycosyltransferase [Candidatus Parcubacteria bacterium]|nr:MAG: phospholipid carrier-dependent glycosyltransferase [Candidatus Parcubacteria bacterium]
MKEFFRSTHPEVWVILAIAVLTRFLFIFNPAIVVTDEYHFSGFTQDYLKGRYSFDIHPPLGKLIISGAASVIGIPTDGKIEVGKAYPSDKFLALRIVPAFFGVMVVLLLWSLVFELSGSRLASFLGGFFIAFDNSAIVQSKLILLDSMLWFFILLSFWLFVKSFKSEKYKKELLVFSLIAAGMAGSVKWTGWSALLMIIWIHPLAQKLFNSNVKLTSQPKGFNWFSLVSIPLAVYFLIFTIYFGIVKTDEGNRWFSLNYVAAAGSPIYTDIEFLNSPRSNTIIGRFLETNFYMFGGNIGSAVHPSASPFWLWPLGQKPFPYHFDNNQNLVVFDANLGVWWIVLLSVFVSSFLLVLKSDFRKSNYGKLSLIFTIGWLINWAPFAAISRPMFLYHYIPALLFGIMLSAILIKYFFDKYQNRRFFILAICIGAVVVGFILKLPITFVSI